MPMNNNKEILLDPTCESELDENFQKNANKYNRISLQLKSLRFLEKGTIILIAVPYTFCFGSMLILFPYLFIFYISEADASNLFALLLILIYNVSYLFASIISPAPCFRERYGWSFALNGFCVLLFLVTILMNLLYFYNMKLTEGDFGNILWVFLPIIGTFLAGFASYNLNHLHFLYLINCLNSYNIELVLTLFYKIFSFGMLIGAVSSLFFHLNFLIIPDLVFKEYLLNLYNDYKLKELVSKSPACEEQPLSLEMIPEVHGNYLEPTLTKFINEEEEDPKVSTLSPHFNSQTQKTIIKMPSFKDIPSHIFKKDMRALTALSCLEALISSYLVLIIPSTILKSGKELNLTIEEIFYRFSFCYIVIGLSQSSTLFIKKFNYNEDPRYSCHEILKAFSFLIVVYAIAYFFNFYPLILLASCFLGYCYFLTILVIENQIFLHFEQMTLNISSVNIANCLIKALIFVIGLILIDTNPINSLIIYIILVFFIWCLNKK